MDLGTENELLVHTDFFALRIKPIELETYYLASFNAQLDLISYPKSRSQLSYQGCLWFSFDNIADFGTDIQNIINHNSQEAQLKCIDNWAVITIRKYAEKVEVSTQIIADISIAQTTIKVAC